MDNDNASKGTCEVCGRTLPLRQLTEWHGVRPSLSALIRADRPDWAEGGRICHDDLARYRRLHVERILEEERGELSTLERRVVDSLAGGPLVATSTVADEADATLGERMADRIAEFGGSWMFILGFVGVLLFWIALNVTGLLFRPYDPYPFILLNLVLSCLAALQAPVIMMSQRRQEIRDRRRAENDYQVNLKAELEIRQLHEKLDHQIARQWERLTELQQIQIDLLEDRVSRE